MRPGRLTDRALLYGLHKSRLYPSRQLLPILTKRHFYRGKPEEILKEVSHTSPVRRTLEVRVCPRLCTHENAQCFAVPSASGYSCMWGVFVSRTIAISS